MPESERGVYKVFIRGSIDAVWREITKTDSAQQCMFNMVLHTTGLAAGKPVQWRTKNGKYTGVVGEVLEFDPPHRFSHTFRFARYDDPPCKVTYDLKEVTGGVEFTLTLSDLPEGTKTAKDMLRGSSLIVNTLKSVVETGRVPFGARLLFILMRLLEPLNPKKARSENWPL